ncbi:zinc-ribbon domain containing protein [bacterium]|nr:zinc-ribbon domain containing protein [bacterium]
MDFQDQQLACDACGGTFTWSCGEQEFFALKGLTQAPKRCLGARRARKNGDHARYEACPFADGARPIPQNRPREHSRAAGAFRSSPRLTPGVLNGTVLKVLQDKGFGFLRGDDDQDYYFNESSLLTLTMHQLSAGSRVSFEAAHSARGLRAQNVCHA